MAFVRGAVIRASTVLPDHLLPKSGTAHRIGRVSLKGNSG